jgi:hypothetical protein
MGTDPRFVRGASSDQGVRPFRIAIRALTVALIAALGLFGGTAYAYFAGSGAGSGHAGVGKMSTVTLVAVVSTGPNSNLSPGHSGDVLLKVKNPNPRSVTLVKVTWTGGAVTADAGHPSCTTTGVTFTNWTGVISIPRDTATNGYPEGYPVHLTGHATMSDSSSNGCQGATFYIPVIITVKLP